MRESRLFLRDPDMTPTSATPSRPSGVMDLPASYRGSAVLREIAKDYALAVESPGRQWNVSC